MKFAPTACLFAFLAVVSAAQPLPATAQGSILNQSGDELLKDFGLDPSQLPPQYAKSAPSPAPAAPGTALAPTQPQSPTTAQGQFLQSQPGGGAKSTLLRMLSGAIPKVDVDKAGGVKVKAPFVNVNVGNGQHHVQVSAPFVNYNTGQGARVHVPGILNINPQSGAGVPGTSPQAVPGTPPQPVSSAASDQGSQFVNSAPAMVHDSTSPATRIPHMIPDAFGK